MGGDKKLVCSARLTHSNSWQVHFSAQHTDCLISNFRLHYFLNKIYSIYEMATSHFVPEDVLPSGS